jgi:hypothetical protein
MPAVAYTLLLAVVTLVEGAPYWLRFRALRAHGRAAHSLDALPALVREVMSFGAEPLILGGVLNRALSVLDVRVSLVS